MPWTCDLELADDCLEGGPFDAPHCVEGRTACERCYEVLERRQTPYGVTD